MAEVVQLSNEQLIPVYEALRKFEIFSKEELDMLIKKCDRYEYRIQKTVKDPRDFLSYAEYLTDTLKLFRVRKQQRVLRKLKVFGVEHKIRMKIEDIYKRACDRFQGRRDIWHKRCSFLKREKMYNQCSKVYMQFFQVKCGLLEEDSSLCKEIAEWEFEENCNMKNARHVLQFGLRTIKSSFLRSLIYKTFYELEMKFVARVYKHKDDEKAMVLDLKENGETVTSSTRYLRESRSLDLNDIEKKHVLEFQFVNSVIDYALTDCMQDDKCSFTYSLWKIAQKFHEKERIPGAERIEEKLFKLLWTVECLGEESYIAKWERQQKGEIMSQVDTYKFFDEACNSLRTAKMIRWYLYLCVKHRSDPVANNELAEKKIENLVSLLIECKFAVPKDFLTLFYMYENKENEKRFTLLKDAVKFFPSSGRLWCLLLESSFKECPEDIEMIMSFIGKAESEIKGRREMIQAYKLALDWAQVYSPKHVDEIFLRGRMHPKPYVVFRMLRLRIRFLAERYRDTPDIYRAEYLRLADWKPNCWKFHKSFIILEKAANFPRTNLITTAYKKALDLVGKVNENVWVEYGLFVASQQPNELQYIYKRALLTLSGDRLERFKEKWAAMLETLSAGNSSFQHDDFYDSDTDYEGYETVNDDDELSLSSSLLNVD